MPIVTTLNFCGRTEEALNFYAQALKAETLFLLRFKECPDQHYAQSGMGELVFHARFRIDGTELMASDVGFSNDTKPTPFSGFALTLSINSIERARCIFTALSEEGHVLIPLAQSNFTSWYGIVIDRFGVSWKLNVSNQSHQ